MIRMISGASALEVVIRTVVIFTVTFAVIRIRGNKQLAQLSVFDALLVIALGSAVGDVMVYPEEEVPLLRSALAICTLVAMVFIIEYGLARASKSIVRFIQGQPVVLVRGGRLIHRNLKRANISEEQLRTKLRAKSVNYFSQVRLLRLEPDGELSLVRRKKAGD